MDKSITTAEELARIGRENDLAEIEYEDPEVKIRITFEAPVAASAPTFDPSLLAAAGLSAAHQVAPPAAAPQAAPAPSANGGVATSGETINSPLAGVFYRSPRPRVAMVPTANMVVEAMKLMNEITAERPCKIVKILVENAEAVEEGQPLFIID